MGVGLCAGGFAEHIVGKQKPFRRRRLAANERFADGLSGTNSPPRIAIARAAAFRDAARRCGKSFANCRRNVSSPDDYARKSAQVAAFGQRRCAVCVFAAAGAILSRISASAHGRIRHASAKSERRPRRWKARIRQGLIPAASAFGARIRFTEKARAEIRRAEFVSAISSANWRASFRSSAKCSALIFSRVFCESGDSIHWIIRQKSKRIGGENKAIAGIF